MANEIYKSTFSGVQLRASSKTEFALEGVAAAYDQPSKPIPGGPAGLSFTERIKRGAFARTLRDSSADVKALFNHDANYVLGRRKNGTLTLTDTDEGLAFRVQLDQRNGKHQDLYRSVQTGLIDECSFAFTVAKDGQVWNRDYTERTLTDVNLFDISIVTTPAYDSTRVAARSAHYVLTQDWRSRALAALARLEPVLEAERKAAADPAAQYRAYLDELAEARRQGWM